MTMDASTHGVDDGGAHARDGDDAAASSCQYNYVVTVRAFGF